MTKFVIVVIGTVFASGVAAVVGWSLGVAFSAQHIVYGILLVVALFVIAVVAGWSSIPIAVPTMLVTTIIMIAARVVYVEYFRMPDIALPPEVAAAKVTPECMAQFGPTAAWRKPLVLSAADAETYGDGVPPRISMRWQDLRDTVAATRCMPEQITKTLVITGLPFARFWRGNSGLTRNGKVVDRGPTVSIRVYYRDYFRFKRLKSMPRILDYLDFGGIHFVRLGVSLDVNGPRTKESGMYDLVPDTTPRGV